MYKLFLTLRYLRKRRIAYFAIAAVMLCTAMVLIVMSVMGGFLDQLKRNARGLLGDIIVDNGRSVAGFPLYDEFIAEISSWPEIEQATPVLYSWGLLRLHSYQHPEDGGQLATVRVVGIRLHEAFAVNAFQSSLYYEKHYPDTTTLADQQQPLIGFVPGRGVLELEDPDGRVLRVQPALPPEYEAALERSRAAGIVDDQTAPTLWSELMVEAGLPPIVGVYANVDDFGPPTLAGEPRPGLIIGRDIVAFRLPSGLYQRTSRYPRGCLATLTLVPFSRAGTIDTPVKQPFRYTDDSRTGIYQIDSQHVYCDFDLLQKLLLMQSAERVDPVSGRTIGTVPARCSQIQIKVRPGLDARALAALTDRLRTTYRRLAADPTRDLDAQEREDAFLVDALTWEQSQQHIIAPVEKERRLVTILFGIISLVAAVLVLCILYMIVLQKTRDIGIVKSVGGSAGGVALIFVSYGAAVGLVGSAAGAILGYYFVRYINEFQDFLTSINPAWQVWDRSVYSFDAIPNTVRPADMAVVIAAAIAAATLGAVVAALRAGFMQPVEALRHE